MDYSLIKFETEFTRCISGISWLEVDQSRLELRNFRILLLGEVRLLKNIRGVFETSILFYLWLLESELAPTLK